MLKSLWSWMLGSRSTCDLPYDNMTEPLLLTATVMDNSFKELTVKSETVTKRYTTTTTSNSQILHVCHCQLHNSDQCLSKTDSISSSEPPCWCNLSQFDYATVIPLPSNTTETLTMESSIIDPQQPSCSSNQSSGYYSHTSNTGGSVRFEVGSTDGSSGLTPPGSNEFSHTNENNNKTTVAGATNIGVNVIGVVSVVGGTDSQIAPPPPSSLSSPDQPTNLPQQQITFDKKLINSSIDHNNHHQSGALLHTIPELGSSTVTSNASSSVLDSHFHLQTTSGVVHRPQRNSNNNVGGGGGNGGGSTRRRHSITDDQRRINVPPIMSSSDCNPVQICTRKQRRCSLAEIGYGKLETYSKLNKLGQGTYASVYKGRSRLTESLVALKEIRLEQEEGAPCTAIREISILRDLKHANIVTLHDIIHTHRSLTLVFEYVDRDLKQYLDDCNSLLHMDNVRLFLYQLLRGLQFCHSRQILHRDLKPQNLLITDRGELKLADFGLARTKSIPIKTYSNEVVTLWYRPPDVLLGSTDYSTPIDMWGVGCIFFEMAAGRPCFPGSSIKEELLCIFKYLGTPCETTWPSIGQNKTFIDYAFPVFRGESLHSLAPRLCNDGNDLLHSFLQYCGKRRISALRALQHPYFTQHLPMSTLSRLPSTMSIFDVAGIELKDDPGKASCRQSHRHHHHHQSRSRGARLSVAPTVTTAPNLQDSSSRRQSMLLF